MYTAAGVRTVNSPVHTAGFGVNLSKNTDKSLFLVSLRPVYTLWFGVLMTKSVYFNEK